MWAEPLHTGLSWGGLFPALMKPGKPEHIKGGGIQIQEAMTSLSFGQNECCLKY